jgi:hypothetical protein
VPLDAGKGEQRHKAGDDDQRGKNMARSTSLIALTMAASLPVNPPGGFPILKRIPGRSRRRRPGEPPEDVLNENDGRHDDEAEVYRADREQGNPPVMAACTGGLAAR